MPNWCENCLRVEGSKEELKEFYEKGLEKNPNKEQGTWSLSPYHLYQAKWDADLKRYYGVHINDDVFTANFETEGAAPIACLIKLQSDYPTLDFELEYIENGSQFKGRAFTIIEDGNVELVDEKIDWVSLFGGSVKFTDIEWDCDDNTDLPEEVILEVTDVYWDFDEEGAELLSNEFGYYVESFSYEIVHRNEDDN